MKALKAHLDKQIEYIADTATDDHVSVIVQMESKEDLRGYLESTSEAIGQRRSVATARALIPPPLKQIKTNAEGKFTPAVKRHLTQSNSNIAATFLSSQIIKVMGVKLLGTVGLSSLQPLLDSPWVQGVVARAVQAGVEGIVKSKKRFEPIHFATSGSAVLRLTKSELKELPTMVPNVADIYPNRKMRVPPVAKSDPNDLPPSVKDHKGYTWGLAKTGALASWSVFGTRGQDVVIAVLDTGVDPNHPDLKGKIAGFAEFDNDGQTVTDNLSNAYDSGEHGTHCAGIIAGGDASGRWIGMAPEAKVLAGLVLKNGSGTDAQVLAGMEWAINNGAQVISMSLGGLRLTPDVLDTYTRTIINANRLGIPVVVAVGNEGSQTAGSPGNDYFSFTVGATDFQDRAAGFSGGRTQIIETSRYIDSSYLPVVFSKPEVSAPGVDIYSSVPINNGVGKWEAWNGTSMATPHVAGAMALLLSKPTKIAAIDGLQRVQVLQSLLLSTVEELGEAGQNHRFGYGRIDVLRALGYAADLGYL